MSSQQRLAYPAYRTAEMLAGLVPAFALPAVASVTGSIAWTAMPGRRRTTERHAERIAGHQLEARERRKRARAVFISYAQYWLDTFRLSKTRPGELNQRVRISDDDLARIDKALARGNGAVVATPHFGSWDLGGAWLASRGYRVTAVAEHLRPRKLLDLFVRIRTDLGMHVIVKGDNVWQQLDQALEENRIVLLVCDRDPSGRGVEVRFFGENTTLPTGPGVLARRHRTPVFPAALLGIGNNCHRAVVAEGLESLQSQDEAEDVRRLTTQLAGAFEDLICQAPEQWHLLQPNWPSDTPRTG